MKRPLTQGGYVGLIAIIIGTAIMLFLFVRIYFTPSKNIDSAKTELQPENVNKVTPTTEFGRLRPGVNAANDIANEAKKKAEETNLLMDDIK